jgi:hypothetical protein
MSGDSFSVCNWEEPNQGSYSQWSVKRTAHNLEKWNIHFALEKVCKVEVGLEAGEASMISFQCERGNQPSQDLHKARCLPIGDQNVCLLLPRQFSFSSLPKPWKTFRCNSFVSQIIVLLLVNKNADNGIHDVSS